jgi:hypothetical protein
MEEKMSRLPKVAIGLTALALAALAMSGPAIA